MTDHNTNKMTGAGQLPAAQSRSNRATNRPFMARGAGLLGCAAALLMGASVAFAQTNVSLTANPIRMSIPISSTGSYVSTLTVSLEGSNAVVNLTATGVPSAGGGAAVVFDSTSVTNTTGGVQNINVNFTLFYTNIAQGNYDMAIVASGDASWRLPVPVKAGYQWSAGGGTNDISFNNPANWVGGAVPGPGDIVILANAGLASSSSTPTVAVTNDTTIGSVSDVHTGDGYTHWNIAAGTTLSVTGDDGFRQLVDLLDASERSRIRASGAGTLVVSNANAEFNMFTTRKNNSHDSSDFSALNTMVIDVDRIAFNDIAAYPDSGTNGTLTYPRQNVYDMDWALTNILRATHTDANGWTNETREYGMVINRTPVQTGSDGGMHFGLWNELYFDSVLFGGYSQMENPEVDFRASSGSYLKLRNTDKVSRVSNLTIADAADYSATGLTRSGGTKIDVSFTKGTVDALIETLIIGRDPRITENGPANGKLFLGAGTFDVNNAFLGYQTDHVSGTEDGSATGRVDVNNGGLFRVNNTLVLGYTVTNSAQVVGGGGQLNVNSSSSAEINTITVGGPAAASTANSVSISGGTLSLSNSLASPAARLQTLSMSDGIFAFPVAVGTTNAFVETIATSGSSNILKVLSLTGAASFPVQVPVISYVNVPSPNFSADVSALGAGFFGYVLNNTSGNSIDLIITTNPPADLTWSGTVNGTWDGSTANWNGGAATFGTGDRVTFNDSSSVTNVSISGNQIIAQTPGTPGMLVTNDTRHYTFNSGTVAGTGAVQKDGSGTLTMNSSVKGPMTINAGTVNGNGSLSAVTLNGSAMLNYSGSINGSMTINGGSLINNGTAVGTVVATGGILLSNAAGASFGRLGTLNLPSGFHLVNNGSFTNQDNRINILSGSTVSGSGTFYSGVVGFDTGGTGRLRVESGGLLSPGNGAGNIATMTAQTRLDFRSGGMVLIECNPAGPSNDKFIADFVGGMQSTFIMSNITATPFAAGQQFNIVESGTGFAITNDSASHTPLVSPAVPGVGLQWDVELMKGTNTPKAIRVVAAPSTPPTMASTVSGGNLTLSWPSSHIGYRLQVQTNTAAVGISTNWFIVPGTEQVTQHVAPIDPANPSVFYRLSNQ